MSFALSISLTCVATTMLREEEEWYTPSPPTSDKIHPTSGDSDGLNQEPHVSYSISAPVIVYETKSPAWPRKRRPGILHMAHEMSVCAPSQTTFYFSLVK